MLCLALFPAVAAACPFCTAIGPTLVQQRESADVVLLAEVAGSEDDLVVLRIHAVVQGAERVGGGEQLKLLLKATAEPGALLLLFGRGDASVEVAALDWKFHGVNETSYGYFARAPSLRVESAERLRYFARFLEHPEPLVAEDAYLEFGHAPYDEVARVADHLPMEKFRAWLADPQVPQQRKGFYGMALGLATRAADRRENAEFLRKQIELPASDFRAGFDGLLAGYLLLEGESALEVIVARYLADHQAAHGDVRHALSALRFYQEYGRQIPAERLNAAVRQVLDRPEFAAAAITDLARWQDWSAIGRIASLYQKDGYQDLAIRRAIVGYLLAAPGSKAAKELKRLRENDPDGVSAAEQVLSTLGGADR